MMMKSTRVYLSVLEGTREYWSVIIQDWMLHLLGVWVISVSVSMKAYFPSDFFHFSSNPVIVIDELIMISGWSCMNWNWSF